MIKEARIYCTIERRVSSIHEKLGKLDSYMEKEIRTFPYIIHKIKLYYKIKL